jgi:tetratricopeptide (TPR) repeat protein
MFLRVLEIDPNFKYALFNLGDLYHKQKRYIEAEEYLLRTLLEDPY